MKITRQGKRTHKELARGGVIHSPHNCSDNVVCFYIEAEDGVLFEVKLSRLELQEIVSKSA